MKYLSEKKAEDLLEDFGFQVVSRAYVSSKNKIKYAISKVGFPCVMKVGGKNIVHKNKLGGIRTNVYTYSQAVEEFKSLRKIKGSNAVMFQKNVDFNKEFILGVKKTADFGHVAIFGAGGIAVEEKKDVSFRVFPLEKEDALEMTEEVSLTKKIGKKERNKIADMIMKVSKFVEKYPRIIEMDINPFVLAGLGPMVLDARILFE